MSRLRCRGAQGARSNPHTVFRGDDGVLVPGGDGEDLREPAREGDGLWSRHRGPRGPQPAAGPRAVGREGRMGVPPGSKCLFGRKSVCSRKGFGRIVFKKSTSNGSITLSLC